MIKNHRGRRGRRGREQRNNSDTDGFDITYDSIERYMARILKSSSNSAFVSHEWLL